jgi:hypothetical protein
MAFRLAAISLRQVLRLLLLRCRSSRAKDLELLVLRQELDVLHRQVPRPRFRPDERWVLTVLQRLRPVRDRLSTLVTPDTIRRWHREMVRSKWLYRHRVVSRGRIPDHVRLLVWRLASENPTWGYCRLRGELKKVGAQISTTSIRRILAEKRRPPSNRETWPQFMRTQASSIIACDLFTVESVRLKTLHVLFFRHLHTRKALPHIRLDAYSRGTHARRSNRHFVDEAVLTVTTVTWPHRCLTWTSSVRFATDARILRQVLAADGGHMKRGDRTASPSYLPCSAASRWSTRHSVRRQITTCTAMGPGLPASTSAALPAAPVRHPPDSSFLNQAKVLVPLVCSPGL